tara:strand:- start:564 stop:773 length:210 start_codon:yes stop_codon:yes gene_type:complete
LGTLSISDAIISPWSWELTSKENPIYPFQKEPCYWIGGTHGSLEIPQTKVWKSIKIEAGGNLLPVMKTN